MSDLLEEMMNIKAEIDGESPVLPYFTMHPNILEEFKKKITTGEVQGVFGIKVYPCPDLPVDEVHMHSYDGLVNPSLWDDPRHHQVLRLGKNEETE
jgi:hypothetical protein